jgi:hypothetical protein
MYVYGNSRLEGLGGEEDGGETAEKRGRRTAKKKSRRRDLK